MSKSNLVGIQNIQDSCLRNISIDTSQELNCDGGSDGSTGDTTYSTEVLIWRKTISESLSRNHTMPELRKYSNFFYIKIVV